MSFSLKFEWFLRFHGGKESTRDVKKSSMFDTKWEKNCRFVQMLVRSYRPLGLMHSTNMSYINF